MAWLDSITAKTLLNPRDRPFAVLILKLAAWLAFSVSFLIYTSIDLVFLALPYWIVTLGLFLGPYTLMLHNLTHNKVFKPRFRSITQAVQIALGPFLGQTPFTYAGHHIGMHHIENNERTDLSTTEPYQRDRLTHFLAYFLDFFFFGVARTLKYLWQSKKKKLFYRALSGELVYAIFVLAVSLTRFELAVVLFIAPLCVARFAMIMGNWAQHAFIHPENSHHPTGYSITCVETRYNSICFNDGYHIEHHLAPNLHFTQMHEAHLKNQAMYAERDAIVFRGLDYFQVWVLLMSRSHSTLARHLVQFAGRERTQRDRIEMIKNRLKPVA